MTAPLTPWSAAEPWPGGHAELLIVGPPGTGKTTTILKAYVWPALDAGAPVLATSFTRAAAAELRGGTGRRFGRSPDAFSRQLSTIHSEATRRCRHHELKFGEDSLLDDDDDEVPELDVHARIAAREASDSLAAWERVRHLHPEDIGLPVRDRLARELSGRALDLAELDVLREMESWFDEDGKLVTPDFTALLELALTDGARRPLTLLAVDEAQDLTPLEWALIDLWAEDADRLLVVGDPDQAIFGWAGADGGRLLRWIRDGRPARYLTQSHRVPRAPHAVARTVILQVADRVDAPYRPADRDGAIRVTDAAGWLGAVSRHQQDGRTVLVLARTNRQCSKLVDGLVGANLPHVAEAGRRLLGLPNKPSRLLRIARSLAGLATRAPSLTVADLRRLVDVLDNNGPAFTRPGVKSSVRRALRGLRGAVARIDLVGLGLDVDALGTAWGGADRASLQAATLSIRLDLDDALTVRQWMLAYPGKRLFEVARRVVVTTCHGSKGRGAPRVVVDARGTCPAWSPTGTQEQRDEDRRVLYVALTRAEETCLVIRGTRRGRDWLGQQGVVL